MIRAWLVAVLLSAPIAIGSQPALAECTDCGRGPGDRLCGAKSLLEVCGRLGVSADLDELTKLTETDAVGTSMAGLQKAAQQKGLSAVGLKISVSDLARCSAPAICYLWGNHFVVAQAGPDGLRVVDPSAREADREMPLDSFLAGYSGFALLVSDGSVRLPPLDAAVPDLRFAAYSHDLGVLYEGSKVERTLSLRNVGTEDLVISQVRPSCTCLQAELLKTTAAPGDGGGIILTFDTAGLRGAQQYAVYVHSNDPVSPIVQVRVSASIKPTKLLVSTRRVEFGDVDANLGAMREIYIKDPGDGSLEVEEVVSDSPVLHASFVATGRGQGEERIFPVLLTLRPDLPLGAFEASITIVSNHPKEPSLRIPVFARVKGDIEVSREALFLGLVKRGEGASGTLSLRARTGAGFGVDSVRTSSDFITADLSSGDPRMDYVVTVGLSETAPPGPVRGEVVIRTDSPRQPRIVVPVGAFVDNALGGGTERPSEEAAHGSGSTRGVEPPGQLSPPDAQSSIAQKAVVRIYVFRSPGCAQCRAVDRDKLQAIAARVGCSVDVRYFDIDDIGNWRKLTALEQRHHDTGNAMPVVFIGGEVLGGEDEVTAMLQPLIEICAAEGGAAWPDEIDHAAD